MPDSAAVRSVLKSDFDQWLRLWEGYNLFYHRVGPDAVPDEVTHTTWKRFFDAYEPMHALVAESDGKLRGLVHFLYHRNTVMMEPTCYLQDLYTEEASRGQGIGRSLINGVYERAKQAGCSRVYWLTQDNNKTAMKLYDAVAAYSGFIVYRKAL